MLFWSSAIATVVFLPIVLIDGGQLFPTSWQEWLIVISLADVCQILGQGMLVHSLKELSSEFVALFLLLEPILAGVGAWLLFSEQLGLLNLVAFAIAKVGVYLSLSSPSALRNEAIQPSFATLQVETEGEKSRARSGQGCTQQLCCQKCLRTNSYSPHSSPRLSMDTIESQKRSLNDILPYPNCFIE
jgi:hypothetical protein